MNQHTRFVAEVEVLCPFCGGKYIGGHMDDEDETPSVIHTLPPCQQFLDMDLVDFLVAARQRIEAGGPS